METPTLEMEIHVRLNQKSPGYGSVTLHETISFPPMNFLGIAAIMKRFHDLAEELKKQQGEKGWP